MGGRGGLCWPDANLGVSKVRGVFEDYYTFHCLEHVPSKQGDTLSFKRVRLLLNEGMANLY